MNIQKTEMPNFIQSPESFLNLNIRGLPQSATLAINERSNLLEKQGKTIYKWGLGQSPFPVPDPVRKALQENAHRKDYLPVKGLQELRDAVARYHSNDGIHRSGEDVIIGPGSKELMFLLQLVYYGELLIPTPSWVSYEPQARILGRPVRWLATSRENRWRLQADELERCCREEPDRPRIVILNYPSNPTSYSYDRNELKNLADVARKYRVILLSDEIYGELNFEGTHFSIASFYPEGTIISGGLSKWCGAGGWRLGTFTFPPSLRKLQNAMAVAASETYTSTSAPVQYAAVKAFRGGPQIEQYLTGARRILKALGTHLARTFQQIGLRTSLPEGAFYLFPDFEDYRDTLSRRGIHTDVDLCERLLEEAGVATLPGSNFGRPLEELTIRIAYVNFDGEKALQALDSEYAGKEPDLDLSFLETYCRDVLTAQDQLCEWVQKQS